MDCRTITTWTDENWHFLLGFGKTVAVDTETTGLNYYDLDILGLSLCDGKRACYIDLSTDRDQFVTLLREMFQNHFTSVIFHNAPFDISVIEKTIFDFHVKQPRLFDTMVAAHLLDENAPVNLKYLAEHKLQADVVSYIKAAAHGIDSQEFYQYAMNDAIWTWQLHLLFNKQLYNEGLDRLFFEIEMPFQWVLARMRQHGVAFDRAKLDELRDQLERDRNSILQELYQLAGKGYSVQKGLFGGEEVVSGCNLKSSHQLVKILEQKLGLELNTCTDTGQKSASREALQQLKEQHPFVEKLLIFKIIEKALDSFVYPAYGQIDADNRLRPSFNNCGTRTGRLSCSNPNLQQLPRLRDEYPFEFRQCFVAPPGKKLIALDYSSQEMRVLAHISQDPTLLRVFRENLDPHLMTAKMVYDLDIPDYALCVKHPDYEAYKDKYKNERHVGKNGLNFPIVYGSTAMGISKRLGMSEKKATELINKFLSRYPKVQEAIKRCGRSIKRRGWVATEIGRRRRLDPAFAKSYRQAFNFLIQGFCCDLLRVAMIHVNRYAECHPEHDMKIVMTVHDEIVVEVNEATAEWAAKHLQKIMEDVSNLSVPLEVVWSVGKNYGACK